MVFNSIQFHFLFSTELFEDEFKRWREPGQRREAEQDLTQQEEAGADGDNRGDPDQSEAHSDVDEEPIAAGPAKKMKTKTRPVQT